MIILYVVIASILILTAILLINAGIVSAKARKLEGQHPTFTDVQLEVYGKTFSRMLQPATVSVKDSYDDTEFAKHKKIAILSCMDTRLTELLPAALGVKNGDVKMIKNAGGIISHPFGSVIRSLLVAIFELGVTDVMVVAHSDCGACHMSAQQMIEHMKARGIHQETIDMIRYCGVDFEKWLYGFGDTEKSVRETVEAIVNHPLIPHDIQVHGFVIDSHTGELSRVEC